MGVGACLLAVISSLFHARSKSPSSGVWTVFFITSGIRDGIFQIRLLCWNGKQREKDIMLEEKGQNESTSSSPFSSPSFTYRD